MSEFATRYGIAVALVALALGFGLLFGPDTTIELVPLLFIAASMAAAWYAGVGPGLVAVVASALPVAYWMEPRNSFSIDRAHLPWFILFVAVLLLGMAVGLNRRRRQAELGRSREILEKRVIERTAQLHVSEQRWRRLFETSNVGIAVAEPQGRILQVNQALQTMLGYDEAALQQMSLADLIKDQRRDGRGTGEQDSNEVPLRRGDGEIVWVSLSISILQSGETKPDLISAVIVDVSARRQALEDWRRAQIELGRVSRLTTMGVLAASIAHEVNQPLSAVVTNSQAAQRWMRAQPANLAEAEAALQRINRDGNRAAEIIRSIRQLLAPVDGRRALLSFHDCIHQLLPLLENELASHRVGLALELGADQDRIEGDGVLLQQLMLNLLMNALDSLRSVSGRRLSLRIATSQNDGQLLVTVEDNGQGFDADKPIDRIFEPFTSSKQGGMGVGLAICHYVVEGHGGRIWAEPRQPHGARLLFTLPLVTMVSPEIKMLERVL